MAAMSDGFERRGMRTEYRDILGHELRWLVNVETLRDPDTGQTMTRTVIRHPGVSVIAPFLSEDRIALVRQYRHTVDAELWELPAGTLHGRESEGRVVPAETPLDCASRELREECGYRAARWEKVAQWYAMPGGHDQVVHLFFAREIEVGEPSLDEGELIREVRAFELAELEGMIASGEIRDAKSLVGLFFALARRSGGIKI
jgi:ADP-ribose pyrophosphatase